MILYVLKAEIQRKTTVRKKLFCVRVSVGRQLSHSLYVFKSANLAWPLSLLFRHGHGNYLLESRWYCIYIDVSFFENPVYKPFSHT